MSKHGKRMNTASQIGLILIVVGTLWVLNNTGIFVFPFRAWWPLILIGLGVIHLVNHRRIFTTGAWLLIIIGTIFLLTQNNMISKESLRTLWPILLILVGFYFIFGGRRCCRGGWMSNRHHRHHRWHEDGDEHRHGGPHVESTESLLNDSVVFGDSEKRVNTESFQGGSVSAVFSDTEIDLLPSQLAEEGATLEISAVFSSLTLRIPESWCLEHTSSVFLGQIKNRHANKETQNGQRLRLNISTVFAEVKITN